MNLWVNILWVKRFCEIWILWDKAILLYKGLTYVQSPIALFLYLSLSVSYGLRPHVSPFTLLFSVRCSCSKRIFWASRSSAGRERSSDCCWVTNWRKSPTSRPSGCRIQNHVSKSLANANLHKLLGRSNVHCCWLCFVIYNELMFATYYPYEGLWYNSIIIIRWHNCRESAPYYWLYFIY